MPLYIIHVIVSVVFSTSLAGLEYSVFPAVRSHGSDREGLPEAGQHLRRREEVRRRRLRLDRRSVVELNFIRHKLDIKCPIL